MLTSVEWGLIGSGGAFLRAGPWASHRAGCLCIIPADVAILG
jgi:hypothetical protein